jgi:hypothetical protein
MNHSMSNKCGEINQSIIIQEINQSINNNTGDKSVNNNTGDQKEEDMWSQKK